MKKEGDKLLNICLVGCGGMAASYRKKYTEIPGTALKLLVDINEKTAKEASRQLNGIDWSTAFEDALSPDIDMVDISTPNFLHTEQAVAAMRKGKHVLIQKPLATTVEEAELIVRTARETGVKAGIYMSMFDKPIVYDLKDMIEKGCFGRISSIHIRNSHTGGLRLTEKNWRSSLEKTGGGALIQLNIHYINLLQWLLGSKIKWVAGLSKNIMCKNVGGDDITTAACEFENGVEGTMEAAYCAPTDRLSIYGSKGFVSLLNNYLLDISLDEPYKGGIVNYTEAGKIKKIDLKKEVAKRNLTFKKFDQHIKFVKAIMNDEAVPISVESGLQDLKVVRAIYESSKGKCFVEI